MLRKPFPCWHWRQVSRRTLRGLSTNRNKHKHILLAMTVNQLVIITTIHLQIRTKDKPRSSVKTPRQPLRVPAFPVLWLLFLFVEQHRLSWEPRVDPEQGNSLTSSFFLLLLWKREQSRHYEERKRECQVFRVDEACSQKQGKQAAKTFVSITATAQSNSSVFISKIAGRIRKERPRKNNMRQKTGFFGSRQMKTINNNMKAFMSFTRCQKVALIDWTCGPLVRVWK